MRFHGGRLLRPTAMEPVGYGFEGVLGVPAGAALCNCR